MSGTGSNNWGPSIHRGPFSGDNGKGCWLWTGCLVGGGYGKVTVGGGDARVHREVFKAVYGYDPLVVRHDCDEPACWRPSHLSGGTVIDNTLDRVRRGRQLRGTACYNAIVNDDTVLRVRAMADDGIGPSAIARRLELGKSLVQSITSGRAWRHVRPTTSGQPTVPAA